MITNLKKINDTDDRLLIAGLRQALAMAHGQLLESASQQWERNFSGKDPSDACVSVHISSGDSQRHPLPCAGILRHRRPSLLSGSRQGVLA